MALQRTIVDNELSPSLAEFKSHIRLTTNDLDADLLVKLKASVLSAEHFIGYRLAVSNYVYKEAFSPVMILPDAPTTMTSVKVDNVTLGSTDYTIDGCMIIFGIDITGSKVEIAYKAGVVSVDEDIKAAILLKATALFNNPSDSVEGLPKASTNLLRPHRQYR